MKKNTKILTLIIFTFLILISPFKVNAGTINISVNAPNQVAVNNTIDVTIKASDIVGFTDGLAAVQGDIVFDAGYLEYVKFTPASSSLTVSYGSTTKRFVAIGQNGEYIKSEGNLVTLTFRAKQVGTTTVSLKDIVVGDTKSIPHTANAGSKTIEIVGETQNKPSTNTPSNDNKEKPSTGGTKPSSGTTGGSSKPNNNNNNKSGDNNLSKLTVNNAKMSPNFSAATTSYDISVPNNVTKLDIDYTTSDKKATVKVAGNSSLKTGKNNIVQVIVTAENGDVKTYTLNVERTEDKSNNKLESLVVDGVDLYPKFSSDTNEYTIKLKNKKSKLDISAIAKDKDSKVEIIDNKNLDKGNSVVLIKVTGKNGFSNYYKLKIDDGSKKGVMTLFGIKIWHIVIFLLFIALILFLLLVFLMKKEKKEAEEDLYDDVVTKNEILNAIEEKDPKKLKMLLTQEEANRLKEELKKEEQEDDEEISKDQILEAIEDGDSKKLKYLLKQEEENKKNNTQEPQKTEDEQIKDELVDAIQEKDVEKLKQIIKQEEQNKLIDGIKKLNK